MNFFSFFGGIPGGILGIHHSRKDLNWKVYNGEIFHVNGEAKESKKSNMQISGGVSGTIQELGGF